MKKLEALYLEDMGVYTLIGRGYTDIHKDIYLEAKRSWWSKPIFLLSSHNFLLEIHGDKTEHCNTIVYDTNRKRTGKLTGRWCIHRVWNTLYLEVKYSWWKKPVFINEDVLAEVLEND